MQKLIWLFSPKQVSDKAERPTLPWQSLFSIIIPTAMKYGRCYLSKRDNHHTPVLLCLQHLV